MPSDTENDSAKMVKSQPTLEPEPATSPRKSTIFQFNASNPDFVPGYSVLRIEQAKRMTNPRDKTRLMNTIVDDIVASVNSINDYHRNGILSDDNVFQVSTMIQCIGQNNHKMQHRLENRIDSLNRQNLRQRQEYVELAQRMDDMGRMYADKVAWLEQQVRVLKDRLAPVEARGPRFRSQKRLDERVERYSRLLENMFQVDLDKRVEHYSRSLEEQAQKELVERAERAERVNRYCEEMRKNRGYDDQEQMIQDEGNADGEWEADKI